jgi:mono/diheme cytochrome c family protein
MDADVFRLFQLWRIAGKTRMKSKLFLALLFLAFGLFALKTIIPARAEPAFDAQIKRGQYLVERVAMCGECHTPKTDQGEYDRTAWLQGDVLDYQPVHPMPFAAVAPGIAGLPTFATDEQAMKFMETGTNALGKRAMPPMPQFRFNHEDAVAVVAYLRSLKR